MLADLTDASGHQQLLKGINRMTLVRHLCRHPGLSRADLATAVGLTKSTVSLLVRELLAEGWLAERDVVATGDLGRRPTPLYIDGERLVLLGAEVGVDAVRAVATSLTGTVLGTVSAALPAGRGAKASVAVLANALHKLSRGLDSARQRVIGIGVGLPGGVDESQGVLHFAPNLGWRDVPVGELLRDKLADSALGSVPLFLQNEADVAALGELEFNGGHSADPLIFVSINQGVGAGVIVSGRLLTGSRGFAGEVGHIVLQLNGPRCSCGRLGCAEALVGPRAMQGSETAALDSPADILQRAAAGHAPTLRAVRKAGSYLGVLLHNLTAAYDPGCIVLGGALVDLGDVYLQPALRTLHDYAAAANLSPPEVRTSRFGADAVAVGAAALARYGLMRPLVAAAAQPESAAP